MKIDGRKVDIILARQKKTLADLRMDFDRRTLSRVRNDRNYQPTTRTIGRLAAALGVEVEDIIAKEETA